MPAQRRPARLDRLPAPGAAATSPRPTTCSCGPSGFDLHELAELVEDGRLKPHVEEAFPLERAADAHERIEGGHTRGKLVLSVS